MEYTTPAIPLTIPKDPNRDKPEEPTVTSRETAKSSKEPTEPAKDATPKEGSPKLFAPSKDFEDDPVHQLVADNLYTIPVRGISRPQKTTANAVEVVSKVMPRKYRKPA
ncbi:hypothetical protein DSO57_1017300 [Entomophthora muscae]|uniref:Uncharacterized protein n=1 Tax=Entomophthora muscae TaxID=34485 RepID=A0ACC2RJ48_9FUNG|nr:hypothetical protein DSO57_1017300 [Entomophthora muscae]